MATYSVFEPEGVTTLCLDSPPPRLVKLAGKLKDRSPNGNRNFKVIPLLTDIHTHGCMGYDFSTATVSQLKEMEQYYLKNGIGQVIPTLVAISKNDYIHQLPKLAEVVSQSHLYKGIHLEGPFLNPQKKGAIAPQHLLPIDLDFVHTLWELSQGKIVTMTVAPELENFQQLCKFAQGKFTLSLGHTACDYDTAQKALSSPSCNRVTHLFNAMNPLHHRSPSLIGAALGCGCDKEIICDGVHLHNGLLQMLFARCANELCMISDCISATGLADGKYLLGNLDVTVKGGQATLADGTIAGSCNNLLEQLVHCFQIGIDEVASVNAATYHPALAVHCPCTPLAEGKNFLVLGQNNELVAVCSNDMYI